MTSRKSSCKTQESIIAAACDVFAHKGYRDTTIRDICKKARVNIAAVNYHFGSKDKLYEAVCKFACGQTSESRQASFDLTGAVTLEDKIRAFIEAFLSTLIDQGKPDWIGMIIGREMIEPTPALDIVVNDMIMPRLQQLRDLVRQLIGMSASEETVLRCCFSITGQCLYYRFCEPVIKRLNPDQNFDRASLVTLADHIAKFSMGAIRQYARNNIEKE